MLAYNVDFHGLIDKNLRGFTIYTEDDMKNPETLSHIINDYCYHYLQITPSGWDFLLNHYGCEKLYEFDKTCSSGFFHCFESLHLDNSFEAYKNWISEKIANYPNVPDSVHKQHRPVNIIKCLLRCGRTADDLAELFDLPAEFIENLKEQN